MTSITWLIPTLLGGAPRPSPQDLMQWKEAGVKNTMNLIAERYGKEGLAVERKMGFEVYHFPLVDLSGPKHLRYMDNAASWLSALVETGRGTVVHCRGGIGRTGTVLIAFLVSQGEKLEDSFWKVSLLGIIPQGPAQLSFLNRYVAHIASTRKSNA